MLRIYLNNAGQDFRQVKISALQKLIDERINKHELFSAQTGDMGLFTIQFTQFSKLCLDQWRLNVEN